MKTAAATMKTQAGAPTAIVQDMLRRKEADDIVASYKDTLMHELYDTKIFKGGQILKKGDYELFAVPIGEKDSFATDDNTQFTKTVEHTNLKEARRLSANRAFSIEGMYANIQVVENPDTGDDETAAVADSTPMPGTTVSAVGLLQDFQHLVAFELFEDETSYEGGKLRRFTSPQGINGFAGSTSNEAVAQNGLGKAFRLRIPRDIWGNRDFGVTMTVFRDMKVTRTCRLDFILDGWLMRPAR
jgi:hypothetical protein